jgi:hypothetical protein
VRCCGLAHDFLLIESKTSHNGDSRFGLEREPARAYSLDNPDQYAVRPDVGYRGVFVFQDVGATIFVDADRWTRKRWGKKAWAHKGC